MNEAEQIRYYGKTEQQISDAAESSIHVMMNDDLAGYISHLLEKANGPTMIPTGYKKLIRQAQYLLSVITYNNENGE